MKCLRPVRGLKIVTITICGVTSVGVAGCVRRHQPIPSKAPAADVAPAPSADAATGPAPMASSGNRDTMNPAVDTPPAESSTAGVSGSPDAADVAPATQDTLAHEAGEFAVANLTAKSGSNISGEVRFSLLPNTTARSPVLLVAATINGATPGEHGFHIHENGDCSSGDGLSAGDHFNPGHKIHGAPTDPNRHLGDLGNISVGKDGSGRLTEQIAVPQDVHGDIRSLIIGRSVVVHAAVDDLHSQPAGNSGARVACGVITSLDGMAH